MILVDIQLLIRLTSICLFSHHTCTQRKSKGNPKGMITLEFQLLIHLTPKMITSFQKGYEENMDSRQQLDMEILFQRTCLL
jgi:hypothetical protein